MKNRFSLYLSIFFVAVFVCLSFSSAISKAATQQKMKMQVKFVPPKNEKKEAIIPRIDNEAAAIIRGDEKIKLTEEKNIYSQNFWMLLFGAYIFLMIFNLSFDFRKKQKLQWFFESVLTFLAIFVWDQLDFGRENAWFAGVVLESGIIIYGFYFYFLKKKLALNFDDIS